MPQEELEMCHMKRLHWTGIFIGRVNGTRTTQKRNSSSAAKTYLFLVRDASRLANLQENRDSALSRVPMDRCNPFSFSDRRPFRRNLNEPLTPFFVTTSQSEQQFCDASAKVKDGRWWLVKSIYFVVVVVVAEGADATVPLDWGCSLHLKSKTASPLFDRSTRNVFPLRVRERRTAFREIDLS